MVLDAIEDDDEGGIFWETHGVHFESSQVNCFYINFSFNDLYML